MSYKIWIPTITITTAWIIVPMLSVSSSSAQSEENNRTITLATLPATNVSRPGIAEETGLSSIQADFERATKKITEFRNATIAEFNSLHDNDGTAGLIIGAYGTGWTAHILDSGMDSATIDGIGKDFITFERQPGLMSFYSISVQKDSESRFAFIIAEVIQNGKTLDIGSTHASYGIVGLSGECG